MRAPLALLLLLSCAEPPPPQAPLPPAAQPAVDPAAQALAAWTAVADAAGTDAAPRALMDHVDPELLGLHPPLQVADLLARFVGAWGRPALGQGAPTATVLEGDVVILRLAGVDPAGRPVAVHVRARQGRLLSFGVDPVADRAPPVLEALEVSPARAATSGPRGVVLDPVTGQALILPEGLGEDGQARVMVEDVHAAAPLNTELAWAALGPVLEAAHACHAARLARGATIAGPLRLRVELAESGAVTQVSRQGDALDLSLDRCARDALSALTFAPVAAPTSFEVTLRFYMPDPPAPAAP